MEGNIKMYLKLGLKKDMDDWGDCDTKNDCMVKQSNEVINATNVWMIERKVTAWTDD